MTTRKRRKRRVCAAPFASRAQSRESGDGGLVETALVGELADAEAEVCEKLLDVEPGGEAVLYIDSPGGSPYGGLAVMSLIRLRGLRVTGVILGECSSAALWPFAACTTRIVTPLSTLLFHRPKWQSDDNVGPVEASEWAKHFRLLEKDMDNELAAMFGLPPKLIIEWSQRGCYLTGSELAETGAAELRPFEQLKELLDGKK